MEKRRVYLTTKKPMLLTSCRIPQRDNDLIIAACDVVGLSRSEFLRSAVREKALAVIIARERETANA